MGRSAAGFAGLLGLALAMPAAGSASAEAFDLRCGESLYHVDLATKTWCEGACEQVMRLTYRGGRYAFLLEIEHFSMAYDRWSKAMIYESSGPLGGDRSRERCRVLKFSGFPSDGRK